MAEELASKRLVDLRLGGNDRQKNYRSITEELRKIMVSHNPTEMNVFLDKIAACLHTCK